MGLRTETTINAPSDAVWEVLTDYQKWPAWNSFLAVDHAKGPLTVGETINASFQPPGHKATKMNPKIVEYSHGSRFSWRGRVLNNDFLFVGEHYFEVKPLGAKQTQLLHGEDFKGLLVPLLGGLLRDTEKGFHAFNEGLKRAAEERAATK